MPRKSAAVPPATRKVDLGWVVALLIAGVGGVLWQTRQLAELSKADQTRTEQTSRAIEQRNRENDMLERRLERLELGCRGAE